MDEGLLLVLIVPTFLIIIPIVISSFILYFILRNKKMSMSKMIVGIGILIIIILIVKSIAIPFYFVFNANINVVKYDSCDNAINVTTEELKENPTIEKVINGEGCSENGALCIITNEEWSKTKSFIYDKIANSSQGCFKFGEHDGFYSLAFNRP